MQKKFVISSALLVLCSILVCITWLDVGSLKTKTILALDKLVAPAPNAVTPQTHTPRRPGPPCGCVFPAITKWSPEKIEALLDSESGRWESVWVWSIMAYKKQRRWDRYWDTVLTMDDIWPDHHYVRACWRDVDHKRVPPPTE